VTNNYLATYLIDHLARLLESLEVVGLGIHGKLALWQALKTAAEELPPLRGPVDYERLTRRAEEQRRRIEIVRLEAHWST
jgi:hypothetical protein